MYGETNTIINKTADNAKEGRLAFLYLLNHSPIKVHEQKEEEKSVVYMQTKEAEKLQTLMDILFTHLRSTCTHTTLPLAQPTQPNPT